MYGVLEYAYWRIRNESNTSCSTDNIQSAFSMIPKINIVLSSHLDLRREKALTIRSFYGHVLPALYRLDSNWVKKNVNKIFPHKMCNPSLFTGKSICFCQFRNRVSAEPSK